jgi:hypothetical protein
METNSAFGREAGLSESRRRPLAAFGDAKSFDAGIRGRKLAAGQLDPVHLDSLLDWTSVNNLLETSAPRLDTLLLSREGEALPPARYVERAPGQTIGQISAPAVLKAVKDGYSIVFKALQTYHLPARKFAGELMCDLLEMVAVTGYASLSKDRCFPTHADDHDVIVVQTEGKKHWTVYPPACSGRCRAWEGILSKGDMLYVPKGWPHHARVVGAGSLHLTFAFRNRTLLDLARFLRHPNADTAWDDVALHRAGPPEAADPAFSSICAVSADGLGSLTRFWIWHRTCLPLHTAHQLPWTLDRRIFALADCELTLVDAVVSVCEVGDRLVLIAGGRQWAFPTAARGVLGRLLRRTPVTGGELASVASHLTPEMVEEIVFQLVSEGLVLSRRCSLARP